jgi:hypothetical protein
MTGAAQTEQRPSASPEAGRIGESGPRGAGMSHDVGARVARGLGCGRKCRRPGNLLVDKSGFYGIM